MQPNNDQSDKLKKRKFKKMKQMITEKLQNINDEEISDSEQVDLSIDLHPIKHYIDDKEEMIEQMFTSLGPTLIQNMLPPMLRQAPIHELKADCLIQLLGMSKKRIFTSIEGKELQSSSDSDLDSEDSSASERKSVKPQKKQVSKMAKRKYIIDADTLNVSIDDEDDLQSLSLSDDETPRGKKRKSHEKVRKSKLKNLKLGVEPTTSLADATSPISISSEEEADGAEKEKNGEKGSVGPKKGQTLLEILELEMRAKAIRSLLKQGTSSSTQPEKESENANSTIDNVFDPNVKIKAEPSDPDVIEIIELQPQTAKTVAEAVDKSNKVPEAEKSDAPVLAESAPEAEKSAPTADNSVDAAKTVSDTAPENADTNDAKAQGTSWSERYFDNKETEKLMKTSKMCTNIRKRMRLVRSMQQQQVKEKVELPVVIGSILEYQQLIGSDSSNSTKESTETSVPETTDVETIEVETQNEAVVDTPAAEKLKPPVSNLDKTIDLVCSDVLEIDIPDLDADSQPEVDVAESVASRRSDVTETVKVADEVASEKNKTPEEDPEVCFVDETNLNDVIVLISDEEKSDEENHVEEKRNGEEIKEEKSDSEIEDGEIDEEAEKGIDNTATETIVASEKTSEENSVTEVNAES